MCYSDCGGFAGGAGAGEAGARAPRTGINAELRECVNPLEPVNPISKKQKQKHKNKKVCEKTFGTAKIFFFSMRLELIFDIFLLN